MARSDHLKRLFATYSRGDHAGFRATAEEVIAEERRKQHAILADELEELLSERSQQRPLNVASLRPLPKGREDTQLLEIVRPSRVLDDVVLRAPTSELLVELVRDFRSAAALHAHGIRPRSRLLLIGPPGTGKTITADALAGELGLPLIKVQVATVVSSYLGETSRNLASIFEFAGKGSWVLLFDEFDALAKERADTAEHGELKRVVTAFLQLLDDFAGNSLVLAASNHATLLDDAVWRRFDEVIAFRLPSQREIGELIRLKLRASRHRMPARELAREMKGFSHAEVELVCHDALRRAILNDRGVVEMEDFQQAIRRMEERRQTISRSRE